MKWSKYKIKLLLIKVQINFLHQFVFYLFSLVYVFQNGPFFNEFWFMSEAKPLYSLNHETEHDQREQLPSFFARRT